jgi:hypothetical protein
LFVGCDEIFLRLRRVRMFSVAITKQEVRDRSKLLVDPLYYPFSCVRRSRQPRRAVFDTVSIGFGLLAGVHKGSKASFQRRKVDGES